VDSAAETSAFMPFVKEGKMRLIVSWSGQRLANADEVPTLKEMGMPPVLTSP
jgi:tripartite-type tricarboxylate transporter receptor subunit TctC